MGGRRSRSMAAAALALFALGGSGCALALGIGTLTGDGGPGCEPDCRPGDVIWARRFGGGHDELGTGIAPDGSGNVYVTGQLFEPVDFGGGPVGGSAGLFVVKLSPDGSHRWSKAYSGAQADETSPRVALGAAGDVVFIAGAFASEALNLGGAELPGPSGVYVAAYSADDGHHLWSAGFVCEGAEAAGVAVRDDGALVVTGSFTGTVDFGGGHTLTSTAFNGSVFVVSFDPGTGQTLAARSFGGTSSDSSAGRAVAALGEGRVVVAGGISGGLDLGVEVLTEDGGGMFFARLDGSLVPTSAMSFPSGSATGVAAGAGGAFTVAGALASGTVDFGSGAPLGGEGVFAVGFDGLDHAVFADGFPDTGNGMTAAGVAVDPSGKPVLAGSFTSLFDPAAAALPSQGGRDVFVTVLGGGWATSFGGPGDDECKAVAADPRGIYVTGGFTRTADFRDGTLTSAGAMDVFVAKIAR